MSDIVNHRSLEKNEGFCSSCGSIVQRPKEPGIWEFLKWPGLAITLADKDDRHLLKWQRVTVIQTEEGMNMIPEGETEPVWWPDHAAWRKVE